MTFFIADITGILAVPAGIYRIEIVCGISGRRKQFLFSAAENRQLFLQGGDRLVIPV